MTLNLKISKENNLSKKDYPILEKILLKLEKQMDCIFVLDEKNIEINTNVGFDLNHDLINGELEDFDKEELEILNKLSDFLIETFENKIYTIIYK